MNAFVRHVRSVLLALVVSSVSASLSHAAKSTDTEESDVPSSTIHELDKMVISEKAEGIVPLAATWQCTLTGRLTVAPTVPPPARPGEQFSIRVQSQPHAWSFRGPRFETIIFRGTPEKYGFVGGSLWKTKIPVGFPPELTLPGGGQIVAIDSQDVWECNGHTLHKLWYGGPVGAPVTVVIQGANDDQYVFREITLKRITRKKWQQLLKQETPPVPAELPVPPEPAP